MARPVGPRAMPPVDPSKNGRILFTFILGYIMIVPSMNGRILFALISRYNLSDSLIPHPKAIHKPNNHNSLKNRS